MNSAVFSLGVCACVLDVWLKVARWEFLLQNWVVPKKQRPQQQQPVGLFAEALVPKFKRGPPNFQIIYPCEFLKFQLPPLKIVKSLLARSRGQRVILFILF